MSYQAVFQRMEKKYLLTPAQNAALREALGGWLRPDAYGPSTICSLYYDTPDFALIRASLEKPPYKEKLRLRSYGVPGEDDPVYLELKKKVRGIVYKRRVSLPLGQAERYLSLGIPPSAQGQILHEIGWFLRQHPLAPRVLLAYDRTAFYASDDDTLRLTFDRNIRWRTEQLRLGCGDQGSRLLPPGQTLLEIKTANALPVPLCRLLSELQIFPISFSKYGVCYREHLLRPNHQTGGIICA